MTTRRGFLAAILAAAAAPAIVRASSLMKIEPAQVWTPDTTIWRPTPYVQRVGEFKPVTSHSLRNGDVIKIGRVMGLKASGTFVVTSILDGGFVLASPT